ncbi:MAG: sulfotransferase [Pseudomonadota bacterium]
MKKSERSGDPNNSSGKMRLPEHKEVLQLRNTLVKAEQFRRAGKLEDAEKLCRKMLSHYPTYMGALQTFGLISIERQNFPQAVTCFLTATAEAPNDPTNYLNLAAAWVGLEKPAMAEPMLESALKLDPDNAEIHHLIGDVQVRNREYDLAMKSFETAVEKDPDHLLSAFKLADAYVNLGFFEKAKGVLFTLLEKRPDWIGVINLLHQLPGQMVSIDFESALKKAKQQKTETSAEFENSRNFLEASILDRNAEHENAWSILLQANQVIYDANKTNVKAANAMRSQELEAAKRMKIQSFTAPEVTIMPLFIMGASRSGKTTLEVLLGNHPDIKRGYENHNVQQSTTRAAQISGFVNIEQLWRLPEQALEAFSKDFRTRLRGQADDHSVLTNTSPGLIGSAAQIARSLPEAKFVFITRNRDDLVLRILMKKYKRANYHAYNLEAARNYVSWYEEIMETLTRKLGDRVLNITYEDMVANPAEALDKVTALCGLTAYSGNLPVIGTDVGCSEPYRKFLNN